MRSHHGSPQKSERLRLTQRLLKRPNGATGAQIQALTGSTCVHSDVNDLRQYWLHIYSYSKTIPTILWDVLFAKYVGLSKHGKKIYRYRMVRL